MLHGVIMANHHLWQPRRLTQVASVDTLRNRLRVDEDGKRRWDPVAKIIIIDEAHRSTAPSYETICAAHPEAVVLGLTATPCRQNGKGLGAFYEQLVMVAQPSELVRDGFLMEPTIYAPQTPDLEKVHVSDGDYNTKELQIAVDRPGLIGGVVQHFDLLVGHGRRSVVFAAGVEHSIHLRDRFREAGYLAEHIDGDTPAPERAEILRKINSGEIEVVTNCGILTEGWDLPNLDAVVLARPTKSLALYLQMIGRVLRPAPGKLRALVLDHAGNVDRHGWPTCDRDWELSTGASKTKPESLKNCPRCGYVMPSTARICEACQFVFVVKPKPPPEEMDGELALREAPTPEERVTFLFDHICRAKRFDMQESADGFPGWVSHRFKEKYKTWPSKREKTEALQRYHSEAC